MKRDNTLQQNGGPRSDEQRATAAGYASGVVGLLSDILVFYVASNYLPNLAMTTLYAPL